MRAGRHLLVAFLVSALMRGSVAAAPAAQLVPLIVQATGPRLLVVVAPLDASSKDVAVLVEQIAEAAVERTGRFDLVPAYDAFDPGPAQQRDQKKADALKLLAD